MYAGWCGDPAVEAEIKEQTKATIRVIPDAEFRSSEAPDEVHMDRATGRCGGGVGEGVLTVAAGQALGAVPDPALLLEDAGLVRREGTLLAGGVSLAQVASEFGTPAYVYNADVIRRQFRDLDEALAAVPHRICFAVKANSNLGVLRVLRDLGAGADIVSEGEMARALAAGFPSDRIVFSGVGKREEELRSAIAAGIGHVNVESMAELELLSRLAEGARTPVPLGIRVNPDVTAETHPYISTGKRGIKFGIPLDQVRPAAKAIRLHPGLELVAIAMHIGSQLTDTQPFAEGAGRLVDLVEAVRADGTTTLRELDVGGGLGIRYHEEVPIPPRDFAAALIPLVKPTGLTLYLEPGRFLVGALGRPPHAGAFPEALGREGIRHCRCRHERSRAPEPVPGVPRDSSSGAAGRCADCGRRRGAGVRDGRLFRPRPRRGAHGARRPGRDPLRRRVRLRDGLQLQHAATSTRGYHR